MKRTFATGLIVVGILLTTSALARVYFNNQVKQSISIALPDSIAGLKITTYKTGEQAIAEFKNLHGKEFSITSGVVGIYGDREITLWAASAPSEAIALEMTNTMQQRIAEGNSPFTPVSEMRDRNRQVYALEGMGQKHYYFQSKNLVVWLAVDPAFSDEALQQTLEVYP